MKTVIIIAVLFPLLSVGQSCPTGKSWMPTISSNTVFIEADTCLDDAVVKSLWRDYFFSLCGDTTVTQYSTSWRALSGTHWVNDTIGCAPLEAYQKKANGVWINISKCLFFWENKSRFKCYGGAFRDVVVPCCGHFHKTKPS